MFKKLTDDARLPERATRYSAGFDVFANDDVVIGAGETKLIGLGIALDAENSGWDLDTLYSRYYFALHIRSSLRAKGITSLGTGVVDIDYKDEIKIVIHYPIDHFSFVNDIPYEYEIKKGDKIGQLILCKHEGWLLQPEYTKDEERSGGFGSTGK